jgi:hypothetical protein
MRVGLGSGVYVRRRSAAGAGHDERAEGVGSELKGGCVDPSRG